MCRMIETGKEISAATLSLAEKLSQDTMGGLRHFLGESLGWTATQLKSLSVPLKGTDIGLLLEKAGANVEQGQEQSTAALARAMQATAQAFDTILKELDEKTEITNRLLFENIPISSIMGRSFLGLEVSRIRPSFRSGGRDVSTREMALAFEASGKKHLLLCVPGLFCDESLWDSFLELFAAMDYFPVTVRFNPGAPLGENGQALLALMDEFLAEPPVAAALNLDFNRGLSSGLSFGRRPASSRQLRAIAYSQGCLILRSALYYARQKRSALPAGMDRLLMIAPPDRGSYIEKWGFALAFVLSSLPGWPFELAAMIGNERSAAMQDLSHGLIRLEDRELDQGKRAGAQRYFGELDGIACSLCYSLVSQTENPVTNWIGDGVVEKESLGALRKVYERTGKVYELTGYSHFQILGAPELPQIIREVLEK